MPQIAQLHQTLAGQVFWVLVMFGFVFFVIGRGMVPKVMATVSARDDRIAGDLAAADAARRQAEAEEERWRAEETRRRAEAQALIAAAKADAANATEGRLHEANARFDAQLAEADTRIAGARDAALGEIESVASEAAGDIAARVAGVTVAPDAARAAVREALHG